MVDRALLEMTGHFDAVYSPEGRPSIPPERLLRVLLLQVLCFVRSERLLMEQLKYNLLLRWFVGLGIEDKVWTPTVFTKNRDRLLKGKIAHVFFERTLTQARCRKVIAQEHFTVDGILPEGSVGHYSFQPKDGPLLEDPGLYRGQKRSNKTHQSITDLEAKPFRNGKGKEAKLSYIGHMVMENRHGLLVNACFTQATETAEPEAALRMMGVVPGTRRITLGADKSYATKDFVSGLRHLKVTPHVAQNTTNRRSAIDGRTTCQAGYAVSQQSRKHVEPIFSWMKTIGALAKPRYRGRDRAH